MKKVEERFLEYIKIDTKSDENTGLTPSTKGQLKLAEILAKELKEIGVDKVEISEHGYVYATVEKNCNKDIPTIGFIAHMDTAPDYCGSNVNPQIVKNYDGGDIKLNSEVTLSPKFSPELKNYIGKTLITTDGNTLLGADDKAGIAEIMTAIEYLLNNKEIKHGDIKIGFTPDEEIGEGADHFDVEGFKADFAYTLDGGAIGELEFENFNAAGVKVEINGVNVHPGYAKNKMINSIMVAHEFINKLPLNEVPEKTEKYEGFSHLTDIKGTIEKTTLDFIIRDFFADGFEDRKEKFKAIEKELNEVYGEGVVKVNIKEQYRNMKEKIEPIMHIVETAKKAMEEAGVAPKVKPIRGGTDGARLSYMGLPTPNLFAGGENFHGKYEYVPVESMEKAVDVILNIIRIYSER
ncbi:peptidase T [Clostridium chauvoei]|uniref:Peptidase T n=2 Tax=Clostridium chauvoei TaxID=46867 RepID=S6EJN3_9CLOT|nr:peptidase T [Clostridium chauvoei]ATD54793.1 peptidase T [Clostridium chauvoei]ATD57526.1 peptidase T [Clostridium chauvoei]MBX7281763.1 peptidase T [Clostridium chauvoei]MBX7284266.1 peptidase T [Clostridium chauvoei]MBX7286806.1 peptidase T [Clostridium chauvoei]